MMQLHQIVIHHTDSFVPLQETLTVIATVGEATVFLTLSQILETVSQDLTAFVSQSLGNATIAPQRF